MIRKYRSREALSLIIGEVKAGYFFEIDGGACSIRGIQTTDGSRDGFAVSYQAGEVWILWMDALGATNLREGEAMASHLFTRERLERMGYTEVFQPRLKNVTPDGEVYSVGETTFTMMDPAELAEIQEYYEC